MTMKLPDRIYVERDPETNEKRWYSVKGMGEEYVRASVAPATPGYAAGFEACRAAAIEVARTLDPSDDFWDRVTVGWEMNPGPGRVERNIDLKPARRQFGKKIAEALSALPAPAPAAEEVTVEKLAAVAEVAHDAAMKKDPCEPSKARWAGYAAIFSRFRITATASGRVDVLL